jgi:uncharacterized protein (TIGR00156 family)
MKKLLLLTIVLLGGVGANGADAKFIGPSDKSGDQAIMTVSEVSKLGDDKMVVMKGSIEKHLTKDRYQFVDVTGKIVVDIDGDEWRGLDVRPTDTVIIIGETDKGMFHDLRVDVDSIKKVE